MEETKRVGFTRRALLTAAVAGGAGFAGPTLVSPLNANVSDDAVELIKQLTGKIPTESDKKASSGGAILSPTPSRP
jgi:sulfur-oxidizing protein SoxY